MQIINLIVIKDAALNAGMMIHQGKVEIVIKAIKTVESLIKMRDIGREDIKDQIITAVENTQDHLANTTLLQNSAALVEVVHRKKGKLQ